MASAPAPEFLEPQWFVPLFVSMWIGITGLVSYISGWASLASTFNVRDDIDGERFRFCSGSLGWRYFPVSYGNCLFVTVNEVGFWLSILFIFRVLSPPFFVPWSKVVSVEERGVLFFKYYVLSIRDHWSRVSVWGSAGRQLKERFDASHAIGRSNTSLERTRER